MKYLKVYGKTLVYIIISLLLSLLLLTIFYYFNLINSNTYKILKIITILSSIFINSLNLGKHSKSKGYLEGLKIGSLIVLIFFITALITNTFKIKNIIYYLILIITSSLGSMIGISKKKTPN